MLLCQFPHLAMAQFLTDRLDRIAYMQSLDAMSHACQLIIDQIAAKSVGKHLPYEVLIGSKHTRMIGGT